MPMLYRDFSTQAQIDAQYNASASVPDPAACMRHYADCAQRARRELRCVLDVPYGPTRAETLDIFPAHASGKPDAPVFVFLHGGYWRALSSKDFSGIALGLQPLGVTTVVVDYALCPKVEIGEIVRQVRAALAWVLRNIHRHGGDPARVAIGGHSAGGHLAAMSLLTDWAGDYGLPPDPFAGAVLVSGLYDLEPLRWSYLQPAIQLDDRSIRRCSPLSLIRRCATPILTTWGGAESSEFERQSRAFHDGWIAAGNRSELRAQPGCDHFSAIHGFETADGELARWIAQALRP